MLDIAKDPSEIKSDAFLKYPPTRQAFVLDLASDYLRYRSIADESHAAEYRGIAIAPCSRLAVQYEPNPMRRK